MLLSRHVKVVHPYLCSIQPLLEIVQGYLEFEVTQEEIKSYCYHDVMLDVRQLLFATHPSLVSLYRHRNLQ